MNWGLVRILLGHELKMVYRDGRTLLLSILLPLLLVPLVLTSLSMVHNRRQAQSNTAYGCLVPPNLRQLVSEVNRVRLPDDLTPDESMVMGRFQIVTRVDVPELTALQQGDADLLLRLVPAREIKAEISQPAQGRSQTHIRKARFRTSRLEGVPQLELLYVGNRMRSLDAMLQFTQRLEKVLEHGRGGALLEANWPGDPERLLQVTSRDEATPAQLTGALLGPFFTLFLVLFLVGGGSVAALDGLAGEKERGSLETLLTTAAGRSEIIAAKQLATLVVALVIAGIQLLNSLLYLMLGLIPIPQGFAVEASPALFVALAILILPLAGFVAAVLTLVSGYSSSYKEAQVLLFPVFALLCVLSVTSMLPGLTLSSAIVLVPVANISVALREVMLGTFEWPWLVGASLVTVGWSAWLARRSARMLSDEQLVLPSLQVSELEARTPVGFARDVARWYALMFVGVLLLNAGLGTHIEAAVLLNQLFIFLLLPLWMVRQYRLNPREAFSLRLPRWPVWLAVLAFIPMAHLVGVGVSVLTGMMFPVPQAYLEQFSQLLALKERPLWVLLVGLAVLPGICEELAFRGTLLYALRNHSPRIQPWKVAVLVALTFGVFHFSLFRIPPTAFLGFFLVLICWWSGSIFPAMMAHIGNNALAVWTSRADVEMETMPLYTFFLSFAGVLVCLYVIYRCRPDRTPSG